MITRRNMIGAAAAAGGVALLRPWERSAAAAFTAATEPDGRTKLSAVPGQVSSNTAPQPPGVPGQDYTPVFTPNGSTLAFNVVDGAKVMHLVCEEIQHEIAPGLTITAWGFNGSTPGPTIEAVEGDKLRIYVTNKLPEATCVHWHGIRIVNGMDGVPGATQPRIEPGETFWYEFVVPEAGTFMYHPHLDEMTQQAMGMMGMFVVHPRDPQLRERYRVDRDYCIMLSEWRIDPGTSRPVTTEMTDFNILTMNSKAYPGTAPLVAQLGERVRIRMGNLGAMDHHPMHLHGFQMTTTETDGGLVPETARFAANTVLVPVGSTRAVEFIADNPGDWAFHCHMTHHTMNQMGHNVPNLIGVNSKDLNKAVRPVLPHYMSMGTRGMGDMGDMKMDVPANSIPMLGADGQFGFIDMGGMFTFVKVREQLSGYDDPGDYHHPPGTVARLASVDELRRDGIAV